MKIRQAGILGLVRFAVEKKIMKVVRYVLTFRSKESAKPLETYPQNLEGTGSVSGTHRFVLVELPLDTAVRCRSAAGEFGLSFPSRAPLTDEEESLDMVLDCKAGVTSFAFTGAIPMGVFIGNPIGSP